MDEQTPKKPKSPKTRPMKGQGIHRRHSVPGTTSAEKNKLSVAISRARNSNARNDELRRMRFEEIELTPAEKAFIDVLFTPKEDGTYPTKKEAYCRAYPAGTSSHNRIGEVARRPNVALAIEKMTQVIRDEITSDDKIAIGVANQAARLAARNARWFALQDVIKDRKTYYSGESAKSKSIETKVKKSLAEVKKALDLIVHGKEDEESKPINLHTLKAKIYEVERSIRGINKDSPIPVYEDFSYLKEVVNKISRLIYIVEKVEDEIDEYNFLQPAPGAETGLITHRDRKTKYGVTREWQVDTGVLTELRNLEDSTASELGQVAPKSVDIKSGGEKIGSLVLMGLGDITESELDERIKALEAREQNRAGSVDAEFREVDEE